MNKSAWKSAQELDYMLGDAGKVSILSCGICANLSDTGGPRGIRFMRKTLEAAGREVVCARSVTACCAEEIMRQALRINAKSIRDSDALVIISCAAGVKSAFLCEPGIPVIPAADSVGSVPVSRLEDPVARSLCTNCGHCVIAFTGGICPLSECPSGKKYEPCARYGERGDMCVVDDSRRCIWREIERRGDLEALRELGRIHGEDSFRRLAPDGSVPSPRFLRRLSGWLVARAGWFARLVPFIN
ncbi:MAG: methylenetetrahydrofolate reductase C-terminal domain-containing protein [Actinobacteria bacterium]|nr:methylenetetrahydrofolate reductase C-terminal domain-containing protein [Actinomycetota bacterium]